MADPAAGERAPPHRALSPASLGMTLLLTTLAAFGALSNNMYLPSLPAMARDLGVPVSSVMATLSAFFIGFAVGQLFYGSLSDRFGRRPVLLGGLAVYTAASVVCVAAPDAATLIAARLVQGLAAAATQVLARAIVRDLFPPARAARMLSIIAAVFAIVPGFAPVLGGVLESLFGWRATFVVLTAAGAAVTLVTWRGFAESLSVLDNTALDGRRMAANYAALVRSPVYMGYCFAFAFNFAGMFAFHASSSFVFIDLLGFTPTAYGLFFMSVIVGYLCGTLASARLTMRVGYARLVAAGGLALIAGGGAMTALVLAGHTTWWTVVGSQFVFMMGTGMVMPNSIAGALAPFPEKAGAASALFGFIQQMTGAAMIWVLGWAADGSALPMAVGIFAGGALSFAAYLVARAGTARR